MMTTFHLCDDQSDTLLEHTRFKDTNLKHLTTNKLCIRSTLALYIGEQAVKNLNAL